MKPLTLSSRDSVAEVYPYGAHVTKFEKRGQPPILFLSKQSLFTPGKAIRGGIPVIFPWFGAHPQDPKQPAHGFARTTEWNVVSADDNRVILRLSSNEKTRASWPHDFIATVTVTLDDRLTVALEVQNTSDHPFTYEEALHTYLTVGDVRHVSVQGLESTTYIDKTDGMKQKQQHGPVIIERETDSVYLNTTSACTLIDPDLKRTIVVDKTGSQSTVIWNPHIIKAKAFTDFGDDEWQQMICIEACNAATNAVELQPKSKHVMTTSVVVRPN